MAQSFGHTAKNYAELLAALVHETPCNTLAVPQPAPKTCTGALQRGCADADGGLCKFPFTYKGTQYESCTTQDEGKAWCSKKPTGLMDTITGGSWGYCQAEV